MRDGYLFLLILLELITITV